MVLTAHEKLIQLEGEVGTAKAAAEMLGVAEKGSYYAWRNGRRPLPSYIEKSVDAHLEVLRNRISAVAQQ